MNKQSIVALVASALLTGNAFCMDGIQVTRPDWGKNGYDLQQATEQNLRILNKPAMLETYSAVGVRELLGMPLESLQKDGDVVTVNCQWLIDLLDNHRIEIEKKLSAQAQPATPSLVTPESKKHFLLTRIVPIAAALGIGYWVGKEGYL